jgi:hypothetical protein
MHDVSRTTLASDRNTAGIPRVRCDLSYSAGSSVVAVGLRWPGWRHGGAWGSEKQEAGDKTGRASLRHGRLNSQTSIRPVRLASEPVPRPAATFNDRRSWRGYGGNARRP